MAGIQYLFAFNMPLNLPLTLNLNQYHHCFKWYNVNVAKKKELKGEKEMVSP